MTDPRVEFVLNELNNAGQKYFIGGSTRFGWNIDENPDLDVFIHPTYPFLDFYGRLRTCWNASKMSNSTYPGVHYRSSVLGKTVDFIIIDNELAWDKLRMEHNEVERVINEYDIKDIVEYRKEFSVPGKQVYRMFAKGNTLYTLPFEKFLKYKNKEQKQSPGGVEWD